MALSRPWRTGYGSFQTTRQSGFRAEPAALSGSVDSIGAENFGCGSSREHAPWALQQYGFKAVIAPSFADIFFNNCFKNGFLPITLTEEQVDRLFKAVETRPGFTLTVDLEKMVVGNDDAGLVYSFVIDPFRQYCLMNGLDDIGLTLQKADKIREFEKSRLAEQPWLANTI